MTSAHCHYCGRPVRTRVFVESLDIEEAQGRVAARVAGITVCTAHAHLVLRDPIHHPGMRRRDAPAASGPEAA